MSLDWQVYLAFKDERLAPLALCAFDLFTLFCSISSKFLVHTIAFPVSAICRWHLSETELYLAAAGLQ
jgi:hypothetical protein